VQGAQTDALCLTVSDIGFDMLGFQVTDRSHLNVEGKQMLGRSLRHAQTVMYRLVATGGLTGQPLHLPA